MQLNETKIEGTVNYKVGTDSLDIRFPKSCIRFWAADETQSVMK